MVYSSKYLFAFKENELDDYMKDLTFCEIELKFCELQLEKIVLANRSNPEALKQVEHFQNQFIIQHNHVKVLKQKVRKLRHLISNMKLSGQWRKSQFYKSLTSNIQAFEDHLEELMGEFKHFSEQLNLMF